MRIQDRSRGKKRPQYDNDVRVGRYYFGVNCPHCKDVSPMIQTVNENLIGARIETIATDDVWESDVMNHDSLSSSTSPRVKSSFDDYIIEVTPTIIWEDDMVTEGVPYQDNHEVNEQELREYLCVRAAKCYLYETNPGMHPEQVQNLIDEVFGGRFVQKRVNGEVVRDPFKGLRTITHSY